jgi:urocanate hydratase
LFLAPVTAAQITAGAWVLIQEQGIGQVFITTATSAVSGATVWAQSASGTTTVATSAVTTASYAGTLGNAIDLPTVQSLCRVQLDLPLRQG